MPLSNPQRATLLAAVKADPTAAAIRVAGDTFSLLAWCNGASATLAWRIAVPPQDADEAATYTTYDSLVAGKRDSWSIFLKFNRDFSRGKVRAWIVDVWGSATAASVAEAVIQAGTEFATRAQAALGGTLKTTGTVSASDRAYAAQIAQSEVDWLVAQA